MFKKDKQQASRESERSQPTKHPRKYRVLKLILGSVVVFSCIGAGTVWYYGGRVLPNVMVGNSAVGQKTADEIERIVKDEQAALTVTFTDGTKSTTVPTKDLGVSVNIAATVTQALQARRGSNLFQDVSIWQPMHIPLVLTNDPGIVKEYVQQHYPSIFVDAKDASLTYDNATSQFTIIPGSQGRGFDITHFESSLSALALNPHNMQLDLTTRPVEPFIQASGLVNVQKDINQRIQLPITFSLNGKTAYQSKPADIASWTSFTPDTVKGTATIAFDKAKIQQFITDQISPSIALPPIDRKVVIDTATNTQSVLQEGQAGQQLSGIDTLTNNVFDALQSNKPLAQSVSITEAPFKTVTLSGDGRWIEVDLSKQMVTLYVGTTPLQSFLISSGLAATPTEIGTFAVWHKTPMQTMTETVNGDYYYIPNIPWVSYFDDGEAFHGTYWHHNFGHPMSHGCINMTIADAKVVYDFAPVGTKVVVHD